MTDFEIVVTVRGAEREGCYSPERDTLAHIAVPIDSGRAWDIYQEAVARAVSPRLVVNYLNPEDIQT